MLIVEFLWGGMEPPVSRTHWLHWLRHTAGSHQADGGVDLRTVRDNLGHVSLNTASLYLHKEEDKRHRETVARHKMNWGTQPSAKSDGSEANR
ncbi:hypothetical protein WM31_08715 [Burkholderia ubonensis]|nr:hypothetical protein WM31_08715 [Burkholderia ubonensis]